MQQLENLEVGEESIVPMRKQKESFIHTLLSPLYVRNFRLLFSGQAISGFGDAFYVVALPWLILSNGGNGQDLGIVLAAYGVPRIGTLLLGGWLSDRLRPYRVMLLADIVRVILIGILSALALRGYPPVWQLCAIAVPLGASTGLFFPAYFAVIPEVLPDKDIQSGNALNSIFDGFASLVGPGIAGVVVNLFQPGIALLVDTASFMVSVITLAAIRKQPVSEQAEQKSIKTQATENATPADASAVQKSQQTFLQFLLHSRLFQIMLLVLSVANATGGAIFAVALPVFAHDALAKDASSYGLLLGAFSTGALLGGLGSGKLGNIKHRGIMILLLWVGQAVAIISIPLISNDITGVLLLGAMGVCNGLSNVTFRTSIQQSFPRHLLGRIMGVVMFTEYGLYPLSVTLGGFVVTHYGYVLIFALGGCVNLLAVIFGLFQHELREL